MSFITKSLSESLEKIKEYEKLIKDIEQIQFESKFYSIMEKLDQGSNKVFLMNRNEDMEALIVENYVQDFEIIWNNKNYIWNDVHVLYEDGEIQKVSYPTYRNKKYELLEIPKHLIDSSFFSLAKDAFVILQCESFF